MGKRGPRPSGRALTNGQRQAAYKARHRAVVAIDDLAVYCWCHREIVHVPPVELRAGRTRSCGRRGCTDGLGDVG